MVALTFNAFLPGFVAYAENVDGDGEPAATEDILAPTTDPEEPTTNPEEPTANPEELVANPEELVANPEEPTADPEEPVAESTILGIQSVEKQSELSELSSLDNGLSTFDINPCEGKKVCVNNISGYDSLSEAIDAAADSARITLLSGVEITSTPEIKKNLIIDLNGYDIKATNMRALWIKNGEVTITGGGTISANKEGGSIFSDSSSVIRVGDSAANTNKAKLIIGEKVTVSSNHCYGITVFGNNDIDGNKTTSDIEVVINGKVIVSGTASGISGNGTSTYSATTITIGSTGKIQAVNEYAIYHPGKGILTVNGEVEGKGGIEIKSGTGIINAGAAITATATAQGHKPYNNGPSSSGYAIAAISNNGYVGDPTMTINGGTIIGKVSNLLDNGETLNAKIEVSGGTFSESVPVEYQVDNATILVEGAEAKIENVEYKTLADAITNAKDDDTILLLNKAIIDGKFDSTKKITIDLNGKVAKFSLNIIGGAISLTGQGSIEPADGAVLRLYGLPEGEGIVANIGKNIILKGGVYIFGNKYYESSAAAALANSGKVELNLEGKIQSSARGISVNGNITNTGNYPTVNVKEGAEIVVSGETPGIYQAGYSVVNIETGTKVSGGESAVEIRAGKLNIDGGEFISTATTYKCDPNGGGSTTLGAAVAIAQHTTKSALDAKINGGTFNGVKALSICNPQNNDAPVPTISVKGGTFVGSDAAVENSAIYGENKILNIIEGGTFSSELSGDYVKAGKAIVNVADDTVTPYHVGEKVTVTFNANGGTVNPTTKDIVKGDKVVKPSNPIHSNSCYQFNNWTKDGSEFNFDTVINSDITLTANWNYTCSRSSGGGGSSKSSSDDVKEVVLGGEVEVNTGDKAEINTGDENKLDENTDGNNGNGNDSNYDPELVAAYEWAYKNGITTMDTIEKARLKDGITRAELAKMMVVFMSGVLQKEPVITGNAGYKDVSEKGQGDLAGYIELAYQYQIMGINADGKALQNFNPNGKVSRAEFATVLSRVLYGSKYNQSGANYYELHIQALSEAKILKDTNPKIQELRGWIILMLYRSQNGESNNNSEENTNEVNVNTGDVAELTGTVAETTTGSVAEQLTGAVVDLTGAVAELTGVNAELTGTVAELTGANAELTGSNAELTGSVQEAGN